MLTQAQIRTYQEDGQITAPVGLDKQTVAKLKLKMESFFANHPHLDQDYAYDVFKYDKSWLDLAKCPAILDSAAQLIGDNIICWGSAFFAKKGIGGKATPWHQDGQYWPIEPLETCTVWIAIDKANEENGCMKVIPGSHKERKYYSHHRDDSDEIVLNQAMDLTELPHSEIRNVVLEPGMFSFHDAFMVHGADANNSGKQRGGITFRFMPASCHFNREKAQKMVKELGVVDISERELFLLRGADICGLNDLSED